MSEIFKGKWTVERSCYICENGIYRATTEHNEDAARMVELLNIGQHYKDHPPLRSHTMELDAQINQLDPDPPRG